MAQGKSGDVAATGGGRPMGAGPTQECGYLAVGKERPNPRN